MPRRAPSDGTQQEGGAGPSQAAGGRPSCQAVHRFTCVQELMRKGCVRESEALDSLEQLTGSRSAELLQQMVAEQNAAMANLGLQVKMLQHPVDKQKYVAFVNTMSDDLSKLATRYTPAQREYFKYVLEAIASDTAAEQGVGSASSMQLLNMAVGRVPEGLEGEAAASAQAAAAAVKKLTKSDREVLLRQLVDEAWLCHSPRLSGHYCIGPRSFLELSELLLSFEGLPDATKQAWHDFL